MPELVMDTELAMSGLVELKPYNHQVGGHCSVLHFNDTTLCKPLTSRERYFYETLPPELKEFTPTYRGVMQVQIIEDNDTHVTLVGIPPKSLTQKHSPVHHRSSALPCSPVVPSDPETESKQSLIRQQQQKQSERNGSFSIHLLRSSSLDMAARRNSSRADKKIVHTDDDDDDDEDEHDEDDEEEEEEDVFDVHRQDNFHPSWSIRCPKMQLSKLLKSGHSDCYKFILLENVAAKFHYPCVLDLKMGPRQHGDDQSEEKKQKKILRCKESTSSSLGVRVCGMKVYHVDKGQYVYQDKYDGRSLNVEGFKETLYKFLYNGVEARLDLIEPIIWRLKQLYKMVEKRDTFRFYTSSLLVMYDGLTETPSSRHRHHHHHHTSLLDNSSPEEHSYGMKRVWHDDYPEVEVRMIDFAHSTHRGFREDKITHRGPDQGYLFGLSNLILSFNEVLDRYSTSCQQCHS